MILIGRNLSPFTRRVAVTLRLYDIAHEQRAINPWDHPDEVREVNPLGRVPALVLDSGEVLVESAAILDYLDETVGPERALVPPSGAPRRRVMRLVALAVGAVEKTVAAVYERTRKAPDKVDTTWVERCKMQAAAGFVALDRALAGPWMTGERLTQADVSTVVFWDFAALACPTLRNRLAAPALDRLCARARDLPAFAETSPE